MHSDTSNWDHFMSRLGSELELKLDDGSFSDVGGLLERSGRGEESRLLFNTYPIVEAALVQAGEGDASSFWNLYGSFEQNRDGHGDNPGQGYVQNAAQELLECLPVVLGRLGVQYAHFVPFILDSAAQISDLFMVGEALSYLQKAPAKVAEADGDMDRYKTWFDSQFAELEKFSQKFEDSDSPGTAEFKEGDAVLDPGYVAGLSLFGFGDEPVISVNRVEARTTFWNMPVDSQNTISAVYDQIYHALAVAGVPKQEIERKLSAAKEGVQRLEGYGFHVTTTSTFSGLVADFDIVEKDECGRDLKRKVFCKIGGPEVAREAEYLQDAAEFSLMRVITPILRDSFFGDQIAAVITYDAEHNVQLITPEDHQVYGDSFMEAVSRYAKQTGSSFLALSEEARDTFDAAIIHYCMRAHVDKDIYQIPVLDPAVEPGKVEMWLSGVDGAEKLNGSLALYEKVRPELIAIHAQEGISVIHNDMPRNKFYTSNGGIVRGDPLAVIGREGKDIPPGWEAFYAVCEEVVAETMNELHGPARADVKQLRYETPLLAFEDALRKTSFDAFNGVATLETIAHVRKLGSLVHQYA